MLTLHDTVDLTKRILKWVAFTILGILLIIFLYRGGKFLIAVLFPKPVPPPDVAFGKLPPILFPENASDKSFTYTIDTVSGNLGVYQDRTKVYKTVSAVPNLLNLQNTRDEISSTPFTADETFITDTIYSWRDRIRSDKKITMNIVSKDFTITSDYLSYPDLLPEGLVNQAAPISSASNFLKSFDLYPLDLDESKTSVQLLTLQGTSLYAATSQSTAQLARVDFFQSDLNKIPIVYPRPPYSTMHFLIGGKTTTEILEGVFTHQTIGDESTTYPIRTVQDAFKLLQEGKAYIASYYGTNTDISLKNVYLGYYLGDEKQEYITPVYVFEGKDGFVAYVPAISEVWITQ